jgi:two-component sensor histidine kinase
MRRRYLPTPLWRWFGRNASLRSRLVALLAIAMVLPGVLAVWQATYAYRTAMDALNRNLTQAASLAANEGENAITAAHELLINLSLQPDVRGGNPFACRRALQRAIVGLTQFDSAMIVDSGGNAICTAESVRPQLNVSDRQWFRDAMKGQPFVISDLIENRQTHTLGIATALSLMDDDGQPKGAIAAFIGIDWLAGRYQRTPLPQDSVFAILDASGKQITARPPDTATTNRALPRTSLMLQHAHAGTESFMSVGVDGNPRLYAVNSLFDKRLIVVLGVRAASALSPIALQVAGAIFTPLLMWTLALIVVWIGMERLVLRWIHYLERISSAYAAGRFTVRPDRVADAPAEIRSLGETFARMADLIAAREGELRESLAQKDVLAREIHHRVKNNLQLVISLLNLHARRVKDPQAERGFAEARGRINALAALHRRLYESENLQDIDLKWFLEDLCAEIQRGGLAGGRPIDLVTHVPSQLISSELAVPIGLLVTEAITNAYKHAFSTRVDGTIELAAQVEEGDFLKLSVRDNGVGIADRAPDETQGLGRSLIEAFARQLHGELTIDTGTQGTTVSIRFKTKR